MRIHSRMSQKHMAHKLGISQPTYSKMERGHLQFSLPEMEMIANLLGCKLIFSLTDPKNLQAEQERRLEIRGGFDC